MPSLQFKISQWLKELDAEDIRLGMGKEDKGNRLDTGNPDNRPDIRPGNPDNPGNLGKVVDKSDHIGKRDRNE